MKIPVVISHPTYQIPAVAHMGDAGADLTAAEAATIDPGEWAIVRTGLSMAIPVGHGGFILPRSGLAVRHGVTVLNAPGLVDAGYRGEIMVALINHGSEAFQIVQGDRIAQLVILAVAGAEFQLVETLESTERGTDGFGSTGVRGD